MCKLLLIKCINSARVGSFKKTPVKVKIQKVEGADLVLEDLKNINVPQDIVELEKQIEEVKNEKNRVVKSQRFEEAANLRDTEKKLGEALEKAKTLWEDESKTKRFPINEENIAEVVSMMTGIPVMRIAEKESGKLSRMAEDLAGKVIGQEEAIQKVVRAIKRNRTGLKDPDKPIGSFIFLGPTGVGKTQLAKELAQYMFDSADALIRVDMSEYMEKFAVSRLIGSPPGYVGHEDGGQLTEQVRRRPYSVVLFDEIEKAHPDVFNTLLQVLDEGRLTDSLGRTVDFTNTIIIMTSNVGAKKVSEFGTGIGFETKKSSIAGRKAHTEAIIAKELKNKFAPEFLNRLDDVVLFDQLKHEDILQIVDIEVRHLVIRMFDQKYNIKVTKQAKEFLAEKGYDPDYGARPLKRAVQTYIEDLLADAIIKGEIVRGDDVYTINHTKKEDKLSIKK